MSRERAECQHLGKASIACHECGNLFDGQQAECVCSYGGILSLLCPECYRKEFGVFQGRYKEAEAMSDEYYVIPGVMTRFIEPGRDGRAWIYVKKDGYGPPRSINVEWNPALRVADNHYNAAQEWLDEFVPGSLIKNPGINFNGDFYWGWDRRQGEGEQVDA